MSPSFFTKKFTKFPLIISYTCILVVVICIFSSLSLYSQPNVRRNIYPSYRLLNLDTNLNELSLYKRQLNGSLQQTTSSKAPQTEENSKRFRIKTKGCKISEIPLFDDETRPLFENKSETIWKCKKNLMTVERVNYTSVRFDWSALKYEPLCYYRQLKRGKDDFTHVYGSIIGPITQKVIDLPSFEFVHVLCYKGPKKPELNKNYNKKNSQLIHDQIIPLIPVINKTADSDSDVPNILLLAIDSVSYVNFKRHFIRTERLLSEKQFVELRGYNKVGQNTFPNMIPFLTGHHPGEIEPAKSMAKVNFDNWPIIWKKYAEQGFVTAFVEEMSKYGLFQYNKKGFTSKPTDYQTRPFHIEIYPYKYNKFCYGDRSETEHSLDYTLDFLKAMNERNQKYFAYISIAEMPHDWLNGAHYMDVPYYKLIKRLFDDSLLDNTAIFFFSDHGLRVGPIRLTHSGEMENRMPFMFIRVPDTTDQTYKDNLVANQHRLTTAFDIHATMLHLAQGQANHSLRHGSSLLDGVVSDERTCETEAIPEMFCACYEDIPVDDHSVIKPNQTIPKIMSKLKSLTEKYRSKCAEYKLESIKSVYNRSSFQTDVQLRDFKLGDSQVYIIHIFVSPGKALFEIQIRGFDHNQRFEVIGDISRISQYGNQSHCIDDKILRNYCYCNDLL